MNIQEILKKAKEHGAEAVRSALEELRQENQAITAEARAAYDAYFADVRQREAKIRQKVEALGQERDTLSEKILAMRPSLVAATVEGNTDMVSRIQSDMADIEAQKAALMTQIELLSEAQVPGSAELFQAADSMLKELPSSSSPKGLPVKTLVSGLASWSWTIWLAAASSMTCCVREAG